MLDTTPIWSLFRNLHLWLHDVPATKPNRSPLTVGRGCFNLSQPVSSCPCVGLFSGLIYASQLHSAVTRVSSSRIGLLVSLGLATGPYADICSFARWVPQCARVFYDQFSYDSRSPMPPTPCRLSRPTYPLTRRLPYAAYIAVPNITHRHG